MSDHPLPAVGSLSPSQAQHVDRVCLDFEAAWKRPRIEDYLGDVGEPQRSVLLRELLAVELAYRLRSGEPPAPEEYQARFPEHAALIDAVFAEVIPEGAAVPPAPAATGRCGPAPETGADPSRTSPELAPPQADSVPSIKQSPSLPEIPGYKVLKLLGRGGMGVVYKARQVALKRLVALKITLTGGHAGPQELARFRTEAEAIARLQHANIVQIYEVGDSGGLPYFTLEYVPGGSLSARLAKSPQQPRAAARLVEQLACAVHYAHQQGIMHRDLKPANVLLAEDSTPKVTDFGLAKQVEGGPGLTQSGAIMGTPSYMAPEQARGETKAVGPAADVYALGAILYECLTGRPPFRGPTSADTLMQVLNQEPVPVRRLQPKVPKDLETICYKCLQKEPHKRYASAEELAEDLRRFQAGEPIRARRVGRVKRLLKWARRRPAVAALLGMTALAVLLVFALVVALDATRNTEQEKARKARAETLGSVQTTLEQMGQTTNPDTLVRLFEVIRTQAGKLDAAGAREAAQTALNSMDRTTNPYALDRLSEAFARLAPMLDAAGAREIARHAAHRMEKITYVEALRWLSQGVGALLARMNKPEVANLLASYSIPFPAHEILLPHLGNIAGRKFASLDEAAKWFREAGDGKGAPASRDKP